MGFDTVDTIDNILKYKIISSTCEQTLKRELYINISINGNKYNVPISIDSADLAHSITAGMERWLTNMLVVMLKRHFISAVIKKAIADIELSTSIRGE